MPQTTDGPTETSRYADEFRALLHEPEAMAWMDEHVDELRRSVSGQHFLYWSLAAAFVIGLAAHVVGYLLLSSTPGEPLAVVADLLYALGWALWTGVVVAVFIQIVPELKRRQVARSLKAYDAAKRSQRAGR